jgi:hypothetical protein
MQSPVHLTVSARVVGRQRPSLEPLELGLEGPFDTVRELLAAIVRAEVDNFKQRKENAQYFRLLTDRDIQTGVGLGKIVSGNEEPDRRLPDPEAAIETAVTAFEDGIYYMFVNDVQVEDLDADLRQEPITDVLFVRLTPLAGG